jgi:hypothetical protein
MILNIITIQTDPQLHNIFSVLMIDSFFIFRVYY